MLGNLGAWEWVIVAILVIIIFGGQKLPELGRGLANFRRAGRRTEPPAPPADEPPDRQ